MSVSFFIDIAYSEDFQDLVQVQSQEVPSFALQLVVKTTGEERNFADERKWGSIGDIPLVGFGTFGLCIPQLLSTSFDWEQVRLPARLWQGANSELGHCQVWTHELDRIILS